MERRDFLKTLALGSLGLQIPTVLAASNKVPLLILLELKGGNDGLNTFIPYGDPLYYKLRPDIAIPKDQVISINEKMGFNPELTFLKKLFDEKSVSIVQGVGYQNPVLSHFRSIDIWDTASDSNIVKESGWMADALNLLNAKKVSADGISLGGGLGPMRGSDKKILTIDKPKRFLRQGSNFKKRNFSAQNEALGHILKIENNIQQTIDDLFSKSTRINTWKTGWEGPFAQSVKMAMQLINKNQYIPVIKLSIDGFDTHVQQPRKHKDLMKHFNTGLEYLVTHLKTNKLWDNTLIMTYSEFGRRVAQNDGRGTDHGTANVHFVIGGNVKGGIIGSNPNLSDLVSGNLNYQIDYRQMYATVLSKWWKLKDKSILSGNFSQLDFI